MRSQISELVSAQTVTVSTLLFLSVVLTLNFFRTLSNKIIRIGSFLTALFKRQFERQCSCVTHVTRDNPTNVITSNWRLITHARLLSVADLESNCWTVLTQSVECTSYITLWSGDSVVSATTNFPLLPLARGNLTPSRHSAGFKGEESRFPTNRGPPTMPFIFYFSLMIDAYETTT